MKLIFDSTEEFLGFLDSMSKRFGNMVCKDLHLNSLVAENIKVGEALTINNGETVTLGSLQIGEMPSPKPVTFDEIAEELGLTGEQALEILKSNKTSNEQS